MIENIEKISKKIEDLKKKNINESSTVNYLIRPFFESIGWDFSNPDEVIPEESDNSGKRPDFTFMINGKRKVFIEAKALSNDLMDEKMISEKVGYCITSDVPFLILTNGSKYRIFYSELKGSPKDKILNEFSLENGIDISIIERLSKESFAVDRLLSYSKNVFVLNNIKRALEKIFSAPSGKIINLVNDQVKEIIGHKFGNDEVENALKQFGFVISSENGEIEEITTDIENAKDNESTIWTIENQFKDGAWSNSLSLYKRLISEIRKSGVFISESPQKQYIGVINSNNENVMQINGQKSKLRIWLKISIDSLSEEESLKVRDVSNIGHWGMGDTEIMISNESDLQWALPIILKAYK